MKLTQILLLTLAAAALTLGACAKKAEPEAAAPGYVEYGK